MSQALKSAEESHSSLANAPGIPGLSPHIAAKLAKLGISRCWELVLHLPLRYVDETRLTLIATAPEGQTVQVEGEITDTQIQHRPRRQLVSQVKDASGALNIRFLHFYPSQLRQFAPGRRIRLLGEIRAGPFGPPGPPRRGPRKVGSYFAGSAGRFVLRGVGEMVHPRYRLVQSDTPLEEKLTPVYPTTAGLNQNVLSGLIGRALKRCDLSDSLPEGMRLELKLAEFGASVLLLHHPPPDVDRNALEARSHYAWRRIKFDELLAQQLALRLFYRERQSRTAPELPPKKNLAGALLAKLPFALTRAQQRAWSEISRDLARPSPMQRLLQGDVGSGKTIVAALAALQAVENGYQVALMAPTEILAEQHFEKLRAYLAPLEVPLAFLGGRLKKKERATALAQIAGGRVAIAIGTHALVQEHVEFKELGLAIIDEQHRFGVQQRLALRLKGLQPHQLMMSATPIPRTLAMSYYADLDVSVIDELPPGRTAVVTKLVSESRRAEVIARVRRACLKGRQAYWVCPLIEESETLQLKTALETYEAVKRLFPELKVGLVHGRLPGAEKAAIMQAFSRGEIQLLVATTVIEVGVDVPNATVMLVEHAERMGLAQLHQLRGRVGRGSGDSVCILLYANSLGPTARARLKIVFENSDGFEIARQDLKLRGPGEFLGAQQSGVPLLRFADIERDQDLVEAARDTAERLLSEYPQAALRHLERWMGDRYRFLRV
jgi:ATP-dependent DNA helicase RecG